RRAHHPLLGDLVAYAPPAADRSEASGPVDGSGDARRPRREPGRLPLCLRLPPHPALAALRSGGGGPAPGAGGVGRSLKLLPSGPKGQGEGERRPAAHLALDPDPTPVQLHELLGQRQPEAGPLLLAGVVAANLAELLEDRRLILGGDPDPR